MLEHTEIKTTRKLSYFLAAGVGLAAGVDLADFLVGCVRFGRFLAAFLVSSPVKYEVILVNNDESDQEDFFVSV